MIKLIRHIFVCIILLHFLSINSIRLSAQTVEKKLTGHTRDPNGKALAGVNIQLSHIKNGTAPEGIVSDSAGRFSIVLGGNKRYVITATLMGFNQVTDTVSTDGDASKEILFDIVLNETASELQAVTVTSKKQTIEMQHGKLIYNVQNSALTSGSSALDLLRKVPGVSLGQDEQIMLKGSSGLNVMVDGKMTYLSEQQLIQLLKGMNAENISKIEVISAPTAEFDAAGNAGIINFVTKKNTQSGYSVDFRSGVSKGKFWMVNENITGSYRTKKLNIFGTLDFNTPHTFMKSSSGSSIVEHGERVYLKRELRTPHKINFYTYKLGADWQIAPKHQISAGYSGYLDDFVKDNASSTVRKLDAHGKLLGVVRSNNYLEEPYYYNATNLSYKFDIDSLGKKVTVDGHYISYRNNSDGVLSTDIQDYGEQASVVNKLQVHQPGIVTIRSIKADIELPFDMVTLKAGAKYAYVTNDNQFTFDSLSNGQFIEASSMSNHFKYDEKIAALYISAARKLERTSIEVGLRLESTVAAGRTVKQGIENHWDYTTLFPSLTIDHTIDSHNKVNISVSRRINRPGYASLNPVRWYADQFFYYSGNPYLKPEMAWLFSADYTFKDKYVLTASYGRRTNYLSRRLVIEENTNAIISQSANYDNMQRLDLLASVPIQLFPFWEVQITGGINHTRYPIPLLEKEKTFSLWASSLIISQQIKLPAGFNMEVSANYTSDELWGIYRRRSVFFADVGLRKSLFKGKVDARFSFNDFLRTNLYKGASLSDFTDYYYQDRPDSHRLAISFRYHLGGKLQSSQSRRIEEQDRL
ncbi:MAG: outer membrane beta-barrel protein [Dyadobacter sp.]|uniref:outer membrane beta-barrel protein n=1 Tax=Dyadobacter sp. TaxID=1914288 RepID=UPI003266CDEA